MKKIYWVIAFVVCLLLAYFFFIPAFAGKILVGPVIDLGFFSLRWYGLIIALSILAAYFYARNLSWRFGIDKKEIDDYTFWLIITGFLGARIYYVSFDWDYFGQNIAEIYKIWHGGISIYGGLIAGLIFTYFYSRKKAYSFTQLFDLIALTVPLAQAIGRFGNFFNAEAYGTTTNLPWKMYVDGRFVHPTFLYEAILDIVIFLILRKLMGKFRSGTIGWAYLGLYSLARFAVEGIRTDSFFVNGIRVDQAVAVILLLVAAIGILHLRNKPAN